METRTTAMDLEWPTRENIIDYKKPTTLIQIEKLFYYSSLSISIFYGILHLFISPAIQSAYEQRLEFHYVTLIRLRRLVNTLKRTIKTTSLTAIGENERLMKSSIVYIDRCVQTNEEFTSSGDEKGWSQINSRLKTISRHLEDYNEEMNNTVILESMTFQTKLLADVFHDSTSAIKTQESSSSTIQSIREMKGWFVHGKIPS